MADSPPYPDFVGPADQNILDQAFGRIVKALIDTNAQFLFGAGMSQTSDVPNSSEILKALLKEYFPPGGTQAIDDKRVGELVWEFPFEGAFEAIEKMPGRGRDDLTQKLSEILLNPAYEPSDAHRDFLSVCWDSGSSLRLPNILTTNFDDLIERAIGLERSVRITERNAKEIRGAQQKGKIPVIHLHGVLDEEYQVTETDVFSQGYRVLYYEFEVALHYADAFVFVGYSMNDPDFRRIYMKYRDRIRDRREFKKSTYVVSPAKDVHAYILGKELWEARGAVWFPMKAELFFAKLKYFMLTQYDADVRARVMKKYNLADADALDEYIERVAQVLRISKADALQFLLEALPRGGGR
jgi:hypothetical protein